MTFIIHCSINILWHSRGTVCEFIILRTLCFVYLKGRLASEQFLAYCSSLQEGRGWGEGKGLYLRTMKRGGFLSPTLGC